MTKQDTLRKEIIKLSKTMEPWHIADKLKITVRRVNCNLNGIGNKAKRIRDSRNVAAPGCFNEHERENWLI